MKTHFYLQKGHSTQQTSKVKKAVCAYLDSLDGKLIHAADLQQLKNLISEKIHEINLQFPRCKPVVIKFDNFGYGKGHWYVTGIDGFSFNIRPAELVDPSFVTHYSVKNN